MHLIVPQQFFLLYSLGGSAVKEGKQSNFFFTTFSDLWNLSTCSFYFVLYLAKSLVLFPIGFLLEYSSMCLKVFISCVATYTSLLSSLFLIVHHLLPQDKDGLKA
jgi:hypothetical protein